MLIFCFDSAGIFLTTSGASLFRNRLKYVRQLSIFKQPGFESSRFRVKKRSDFARNDVFRLCSSRRYLFAVRVAAQTAWVLGHSIPQLNRIGPLACSTERCRKPIDTEIRNAVICRENLLNSRSLWLRLARRVPNLIDAVSLQRIPSL
jgi:hypothetical protein